MKEAQKNILYILIVIVLTIAVMVILSLIPGYLREPGVEHIPMQSNLMIVFIMAVILLIAIPAGFHKIYVNDYSVIKNIWFFAIFGGIVGGLLGERSFVMIIPYTILMFIYSLFYKKFTWWKVALTTYLGGILIENAMNHSPLQAPTILWAAFFIYPYFITKIWENRHKINLWQIIKDLKYVYVSIIILLALTLFIVKSIPFFFALLAIAVSLLWFIIHRIIKDKKKKF